MKRDLRDLFTRTRRITQERDDSDAALEEAIAVNHKLAADLERVTRERDEMFATIEKHTRTQGVRSAQAGRIIAENARLASDNGKLKKVEADIDRATRDTDALYELLDCVLHDALESNPHWLLPETVDMVVRACGVTEEIDAEM